MADVDSIPNLGHLSKVFLGLHITSGHIGIPIMIITFLLGRETSRHPTLINFCFTWVIYSVSYCLTLYTGHTLNDSQTPSTACRVQAILVHGAPTMAAAAGLVVVIQLWSTLRYPSLRYLASTTITTQSYRLALRLAYPYIVFLVFTMASLAIILHDPNSVNGANGLYCTIFKDPFRQYGVPSFTAAMLLAVIGFEVATCVRCYRLWTEINRIFPLATRNKASLSLICRVAVFNLYSLVALSSSVFFLSNNLSPWPYMVQAALPLTVMLVFGTQKDMYMSWYWFMPSVASRLHVTSTTASSISMPHFTRSTRNDTIRHSRASFIAPNIREDVETHAASRLEEGKVFDPKPINLVYDDRQENRAMAKSIPPSNEEWVWTPSAE